MVSQVAPTQLRPMTIEEWAGLDEDEGGEFVDGFLEEEELPSIAHEIVVAFLLRVLGAWFEPRGGLVLGSEVKLRISARRGRKPDVVVYTPHLGLPKARDSVTTVPPEVVVEVITARPRDARRDRIDKKPDYAAAGVRQYWLVDPDVRSLEILSLGETGRFIEVLSAAVGSHSVPSHDGLTIDLDALWAAIDRIDDSGDSDDR